MACDNGRLGLLYVEDDPGSYGSQPIAWFLKSM